MSIFYEESNLLVDLLNSSTPGDLSPGVFEAVGRVAVYPAVEFIPLRKVGGGIEVLLFERPKDDIMWPSMLHTPGTVLRPTDRTYEDAFNRLYRDELMELETDPPLFLGAEMSMNKRGRCVLLEHLVVVRGEPKSGKFYNVDNLPSLFIEEQRPSLERAIEAFRNLSSSLLK